MKFDALVRLYESESEQTGPPYIMKDGDTTMYFKNPNFSILHREDGPAAINSSGMSWWKNGKLHREDGPAIVWFNGSNQWHLNGVQLSEEEIEELKKKNAAKTEIQSHKNNRIDPGMLEDYL